MNFCAVIGGCEVKSVGRGGYEREIEDPDMLGVVSSYVVEFVCWRCWANKSHIDFEKWKSACDLGPHLMRCLDSFLLFLASFSLPVICLVE